MDSAQCLPFGALLRRYRLAAGLTQAALAERAGLSERAINDLERYPERTPRLETVRLLADALSLSPHERGSFLSAARPDGAGLPLPVLPATVSSPEAPEAPQHHLPVPLTALLGREQDVEAVTTLLRQEAVRFVTLTGPGGIGKTRLALAIAARLEDAFTHGVRFVDLSQVVDPALVLPTVAQAPGLWVAGSQSIEEALRAYLREKQLLLVLDNFEQVVAAAPAIAALLQSGPGLKALVTSRMALRLRGEKEFPVPPLALPPAPTVEEVPPECLSQYAATALFIQRAQDARPDFQVTAQTATAVTAICTQLDGLPLAIELAAARVKLLSPPALLHRLEHGLPLLRDGARDLPERQRTMRATLAWSYDLLTAEERRLFARLAVFRGGCTLEAAEEVCAAPVGTTPLELDVLEGLGALVEKSLLRREDIEGTEPRIGMLLVIREYAQERLEASGEAEALRQAHALYHLQLAEETEPQLRGPQQRVWLERLDREHENFHAALGWLSASQEGSLSLRLAVALTWFWWMHGRHLQEGLAWLEGLLAQLPAASLADSVGRTGTTPDAGVEVSGSAWRAHALYGAALLHLALDGFAVARARLEASVALWRECGDDQGLGRAQAFLGEVTLALGNHIGARALEEEALACCRAVGDDWGAAWALEYLGHAALESGDYATAERWLAESAAGFQALGDVRQMAAALQFQAHAAYRQRRFDMARARAEQCLMIERELSNRWLQAHTLSLLMEIARAEGADTQARALGEETLRLARDLGAIPVVPWTLRNLGYVDLSEGDTAAALARLREALDLFQRRGSRLGVACCLAGLAGAFAAKAMYDHAARLLGATNALLDALGMRLAPADAMSCEHTFVATRAALGDAPFDLVYAAGHALTTEEAIALVLDTAEAP